VCQRALVTRRSHQFQYSNALSRLLDMDVYLKLDYLQVTGSFKERGARNALMLLSQVCARTMFFFFTMVSDQEQRVRGVIAASAGNHAQALAYHGQLLGTRRVCSPDSRAQACPSRSSCR
jgi:threonine dehydratase